MRLRIGIAFALSFVFIVVIASTMALRDPGPVEPLEPFEHPKPRPADRVGEVIPFQARQKHPLAVGEFRVLERDGRFSVEANEAWRLEILEALAERGDFVLFNHVRRHPFISLDVRNEPVEQVLAVVVRDAPYVIRYAASKGRGAPAIDSLEVGVEQDPVDTEADESESQEPSDSGRKASDIAKRTNREHRTGAPRPEAERRAAMERRKWREARRRQENLDELDHSDPTVRAWAASTLEVDEPQDLIALGALLGSDPDPYVRAEIAFDLGFGHPSAVVPILVSALDDPSPEVVVAAADSLGFLDDASATDDLRTLLEDESESVREAARDALEMLDGAE